MKRELNAYPKKKKKIDPGHPALIAKADQDRNVWLIDDLVHDKGPTVLNDAFGFRSK